MKYLLLCLLLTAAPAFADPPPMPPAPSPAPAPVVTPAPPYILPMVPAPTPSPPPVGVPVQLTPGHPFVIRLNAASVTASPAGLVKMKVKPEPFTVIDAEGVDVDYTGDKAVCLVWPVKGASGPGELIISQGAADGSVKELARVLIVVGEPTPPTPPIPPTPPKPPTPPLPPDPFTSAGDAPGGLRALIVFSEADIGKLTAGQKSAIYGKMMRDYLNAHTVLGADGKTHAWRIWSDTIDPSNDDAAFAKAFKRPHASLPWIVVGNGTTGFEGPLPDHIEDTTAIFTKLGGN